MHTIPSHSWTMLLLPKKVEGFSCQNKQFEYKVGVNKFGVWLSRRRLGIEGLKQIENDKPPQRPSAFTSGNDVSPRPTASAPVIKSELTALRETANSLKLVALSNIASTEEEPVF